MMGMDGIIARREAGKQPLEGILMLLMRVACVVEESQARRTLG